MLQDDETSYEFFVGDHPRSLAPRALAWGVKTILSIESVPDPFPSRCL